LATCLHLDARKIFVPRLRIQPLAFGTDDEEELVKFRYGMAMLDLQLFFYPMYRKNNL